MRFVEGFVALLAVSGGMIFAALHFAMDWLAQAAMFFGAAAIIALDFFALLVWFVNWKYYPEK
jgi:hypothetical protein